jgi:NTP pyrophosphatase (non-canonical NTP hydrolase)
MNTDYIFDILVWNESAKIPANNDPVTLKAKLDHIVEEAMELRDATDAQDQCDACVDLVWVIVAYMRARGWDVQGAFEAVSIANYSKFFPKEEIEEAMAWALAKGVNGPYVEEVSDTLVVLKDKSTKVMKSHRFQEPDHMENVSSV